MNAKGVRATLLPCVDFSRNPLCCFPALLMETARQFLPSRRAPLFAVTQGDPDILAALWGLFNITVISLVWWSAPKHRNNFQQEYWMVSNAARSAATHHPVYG